jgi:hypothetical protein
MSIAGHGSGSGPGQDFPINPRLSLLHGDLEIIGDLKIQ